MSNYIWVLFNTLTCCIFWVLSETPVGCWTRASSSKRWTVYQNTYEKEWSSVTACRTNHCKFFLQQLLSLGFLSFLSFMECDCIHEEWISTVCILHSIGRFYGSRGRDKSKTCNDGFRARSRSPPGKPVGVSNWWLHPLGAIQFRRWWLNEV